MKIIENLDKKQFEEFVLNSNKAHFMQSYAWGDVMKHKNFTPEYIGFEENNKLVGVSLLLKKRLNKNYCYYYCPRGFITDFNNLELVENISKELKNYGKKNKAIYIKIDPDIKRHNLSIDGQIDDSYNNYKLIDKLKTLGYKHTGYNVLFTNEQPRFTFRLNLDDTFENIYNNFHATTKKILNKGNEYKLNVYKGNINDIECFYETMKETAKRENLSCLPINYYKNFYEILNNENMSDIFICKVNINDLKNLYKDKINDLKEKQNSINTTTKKGINKKNELENELNKAINDLKQIEEISMEEITLSAIITVKYKDKVWTIHGGNSTLLRNLNSNYLLYYTIIKDAYDNGYKTIDFFGTSGIANPPKNNPIYGIHSFKKRLGGEYTEFIGEFDLICNKTLYFIFKKIIKIRRKLIKAKQKRNN